MASQQALRWTDRTGQRREAMPAAALSAASPAQDISVRSSRQQALLQGLHSSPRQAAQRARLAVPLGGAVLQRVPLSQDHLNVVGETHEDSDPQRTGEQFVARTAALGLAEDAPADVACYWEEHEFSVATEEGQRMGDSPLLLVKQALADINKFAPSLAIVEIGQDASEALAEQQPLEDTATEEDRQEVALWVQSKQQLVAKGLEWADTLLSEVREFEGHLADDVTEGELDAELMGWGVLAPDTAEFRAGIAALGRWMTAALAGQRGAPNDCQAARDVIFVLSALDMDAVARERSDHMHASAELADGQGVRGVWKVGQEHVDHLVDEPHQYSLIDSESFLAEYQATIDAHNQPAEVADGEAAL